ncbi:hypothetical protein COBT_002258 [Conglomerata obtusa]
MKEELERICKNLPKSLTKPAEYFTFGTAGYRGPSNTLLQPLTRASLLAMIRSSTFCGKTIGIIITASHNKNTDNGIKIIDHNGDYIEKSLELYCDEIVNCKDKDLIKVLSRVHRKLGNMRDLGNASEPVVAIGRDTRESGVHFVEEIKKVLEDLKCKVIDYEIVTTPEMHYYIRNGNLKGRVIAKNEYINHLAFWYKDLVSLTCTKETLCFIDCANGVGGIVINELINVLDKKNLFIININDEAKTIMESIDIERKKDSSNFPDSLEDLNSDYTNLDKKDWFNKICQMRKKNGYLPDVKLLNENCGADYVVTHKKSPKNILIDETKILKCASFDGDADRLIYFSTKDGFKLINGDRIAIVIALYIYEIIKDLENINVGVVLSHYSNSSAINVIKGKFDVILCDTGVKNFIKHSRSFDIGIFFEPNGHGSVTFSEKLLLIIEQNIKNGNDLIKHNMKILKAMSMIFDPCVGDAIANFLVLEALFEDETLNSINELYRELPTRMLSIKIKSKDIFKMKSDVQMIEPIEVRDEIARICTKFGGRAFVRPSGTEDIVRIFAEARKRDICDSLCLSIAQLVYDKCNGIGNHPEIKY